MRRWFGLVLVLWLVCSGSAAAITGAAIHNNVLAANGLVILALGMWAVLLVHAVGVKR